MHTFAATEEAMQNFFPSLFHKCKTRLAKAIITSQAKKNSEPLHPISSIWSTFAANVGGGVAMHRDTSDALSVQSWLLVNFQAVVP